MKIFILSTFCLLFIGNIYGQINTVYNEDFETTPFKVTGTGTPGWTTNNTYYSPLISGTSQSYLGKYGQSIPGNPLDHSDLITNSFTVTQSNAILKFSHIAKIQNFDAGTVWISINGGSWTQLTSNEYLGASPAFAIMNNKFCEFSYPEWAPFTAPDNGWWKRDSFNISSFVSAASAINPISVLIKWRVEDTNFDGMIAGKTGWLIDDINVDASDCEMFPPIYSFSDPATHFEGSITNPGPYTFSIDVSDISVQGVTLYYSVNGTPYSMILSNTGSVYSGSPAFTLGSTDIVDYYFIITDNSCNNNIKATPEFHFSYAPLVSGPTYCDDPNTPLAINSDIQYPVSICSPFKEVKYDFVGSFNETNPINPITLFYRIYLPQPTNPGILITADPSSSSQTFSRVILYGPFECGFDFNNLNPALHDSIEVPLNCTSCSVNQTLPGGYYILGVKPQSTIGCFRINLGGRDVRCACDTCLNCIGSFAPEPGQDYILSAWVKENNAPITKTNYDNPVISIQFDPSGSTGSFTAKGEIIDGWQRIEEKFTIPSTATDLTLKLESVTGDSFFDDIRIFPYKGSMKSYVYDPVTRKFMAELDERNYATLYEYDEEGKLIRVKKETEKGIMTISESRSSTKKN